MNKKKNIRNKYYIYEKSIGTYVNIYSTFNNLEIHINIYIIIILIFIFKFIFLNRN